MKQRTKTKTKLGRGIIKTPSTPKNISYPQLIGRSKRSHQTHLLKNTTQKGFQYRDIKALLIICLNHKSFSISFFPNAPTKALGKILQIPLSSPFVQAICHPDVRPLKLDGRPNGLFTEPGRKSRLYGLPSYEPKDSLHFPHQYSTKNVFFWDN